MWSAEATCTNMASTRNPENDLRHRPICYTQANIPIYTYVCTPNTQAHPYMHYKCTLHTKANTFYTYMHPIYTNKHTHIYSHACTLHTQDNIPLYTYIHVHFTYKQTHPYIDTFMNTTHTSKHI